MTLEVNEGVVRLTSQDWVDLTSQDPLPAEVADLPGGPEAVHAARDPLLQLQLDVTDADRHRRHHAWIDLEAVALLIQVQGDEHQLMAHPPAFLAGSLARLTGIGPRTVGPREPREADEDLLDDLFHEDQVRRWSAFQTLGLHRAWIIATTTAAGAEHRLAAVEDDGLRLVEPTEHGWALTPTTGTLLWRQLTTLLIDASEMNDKEYG